MATKKQVLAGQGGIWHLPLTMSSDMSSSGSLTEVFLLLGRRLGEDPGVRPCITSAAFLSTASRAALKPLAGRE